MDDRRVCLFVWSSSIGKAPTTMTRVPVATELLRSVASSGCIVLGCGCAERLVLLGLEGDWRVERRTAFECECAKKLTIADNRVAP
jgi:hypothetical protein